MKLKKLQMGGYVPSQDSRSRYYTSPEVRKAQQRGEAKLKNSGLLEFIPIYGTYKSAERFVEDPSVLKGAETLLSGVGDVMTGGLLGYTMKGLKYYNKAKKAQKQVANLHRQERDFVKAVEASLPERRTALIKKQQNASNSLSLMEPTPKVQQEILKRQRTINQLKQASPKEILPNTYPIRQELFTDRWRDISEKDIMPNIWKARDAFNKAKQYGTFVIPTSIGEEAYRAIDNTIVKSKPSKNQPHQFIIEKDMKNHY